LRRVPTACASHSAVRGVPCTQPLSARQARGHSVPTARGPAKRPLRTLPWSLQSARFCTEHPPRPPVAGAGPLQPVGEEDRRRVDAPRPHPAGELRATGTVGRTHARPIAKGGQGKGARAASEPGACNTGVARGSGWRGGRPSFPEHREMLCQAPIGRMPHVFCPQAAPLCGAACPGPPDRRRRGGGGGGTDTGRLGEGPASEGARSPPGGAGIPRTPGSPYSLIPSESQPGGGTGSPRGGLWGLPTHRNDRDPPHAAPGVRERHAVPTTLRPLWERFATTLRPCWDHFATTLGPLGDHFAITLRPLCDHFGTACGPSRGPISVSAAGF
jgi:hypothetical protein